MWRLLVHLYEARRSAIRFVQYFYALLKLEEGSWVGLPQFALGRSEPPQKRDFGFSLEKVRFAGAKKLLARGKLLVTF
jgi:hypothetical protein